MKMVQMPDTAHKIYSDGRVAWFMTVTMNGDHMAEGRVYEVAAWEPETDAPCPLDTDEGYEEVAILALKWDGCAHVGLRSPALDKEWVHICGAANMSATLEMLREAWQILQGLIPSYDPSEKLP